MPTTEKILEEYAELVKRQQAEIIDLQRDNQNLTQIIQNLLNKEYDV